MHNDEGVNALKFRELWEHHSYKYDPTEFHGPSLYYATLAFERLTAAPRFEHFTEARLRIVTVLFGIGLILLVPLVTDGIGIAASIWTVLFIAVSPAFVFYSRDYIHEILLVFFSLLAIVSGWRYWRTRKIGWALLAGAGVGLMCATKETFVITVAAVGIALGLNQIWNRTLDASGLPVKAPRLNFLHVAAGAGICLLIWLLMFSSFFTNAAGLPDSVRTYTSWFHRAAGDSPHIHPWNFYFDRLLFFHVRKGPIWSEGLILILAIIGAVAGFARKGLVEANASFVRFLALYTIALTAAYSIISYKTPWCLLNFWIAMILLAGIGAAAIVHAAKFQWAKLAAAILLAAGAGQLAAQAWEAAVSYAADRRNPYVYAQTSLGILELVETVNGLAKVSSAGKHLHINVIAPEGDYWPLPWYLRDFDRVGWWDRVPEDAFAPVMIVSAHLKPGLAERESHPMREVSELRPGVFLKLYVESALWKDYVARRWTE